MLIMRQDSIGETFIFTLSSPDRGFWLVTDHCISVVANILTNMIGFICSTTCQNNSFQYIKAFGLFFFCCGASKRSQCQEASGKLRPSIYNPKPEHFGVIKSFIKKDVLALFLTNTGENSFQLLLMWCVKFRGHLLFSSSMFKWVCSR